MDKPLQRVQIVSRQHPHFEEYGRFTGRVITPRWGGDDMAEVKLENCRHGSDGCFVSKGEVRAVPEAMSRECTCLGACRGREGLGDGWRCALDPPATIAGMAKKRGYAREFETVTKPEKRRTFIADRVPPDLHRAVRAKAKREGISLRTLILRLLSDWLKAS
jgi:hypothetical protein